MGELLGLTPTDFNRRRRQIRREVRQRYRRNASNAEPDSVRRRRLKKQADRWRRIGASAMPLSSRVDSIETDGVGLRIVMKTRQDIAHHVRPIETVADSQTMELKPMIGRKKMIPKEIVGNHTHNHEAVIVAMDNGRAKLFTAAISRRAIERPLTAVLTRRHYYFMMRHSRQQRWEKARMVALPELREGVAALSLTGGIHNSDADK